MKYINKDAFWTAMEKEGIKTIYVLSAITSLHDSTLHHIIEQDNRFRVKTLFSIAEALNINPGDLLLNREEMGD